MRRWLGCALGLGLLLLAPELPAAEESGEAGSPWFHLAVQIGNVLVLGFVLYRFAARPISNALRERSQTIRTQIQASESRLREAEAELAQLRERLAGMEAESAALLAEIVEQTQTERVRTLERARQAAERIREEGRRVADNEIVRVREVLRDEAATLATRIAGELLREQLTRADDQRLLRDFVERVEGPSS